MYCSHCGAPLKAGAQYCESCNQLIACAKDETSHVTNQPTPPIVHKKPMPLWFKITLGIAVLALIVVTIGILFFECSKTGQL